MNQISQKYKTAISGILYMMPEPLIGIIHDYTDDYIYRYYCGVTKNIHHLHRGNLYYQDMDSLFRNGKPLMTLCFGYEICEINNHMCLIGKDYDQIAVYDLNAKTLIASFKFDSYVSDIACVGEMLIIKHDNSIVQYRVDEDFQLQQCIAITTSGYLRYADEKKIIICDDGGNMRIYDLNFKLINELKFSNRITHITNEDNKLTAYDNNGRFNLIDDKPRGCLLL